MKSVGYESWNVKFFFKVFFILFSVVQTTVSTVVGMEKHYDDFCLVGELSGRRFVVSNGKFGGDFTFYSHTNVKIIDKWSLTTFDKGMNDGVYVIGSRG